MQFFKLSVIAAITTLAAATPSPQLGGLPSLPVCLTGGTLTGVLPAGLNLVSCASGETCEPMSTVLTAVPILGSILGGVVDELPVGVGWGLRLGWLGLGRLGLVKLTSNCGRGVMELFGM
ncbi:uncharacterized protein FOMMEDRAFT_169920 [Fomitiporia mediterranea MF3/22]|uniref:uncharacterized protein n=1 Tax=Fomitiporia mediterranea (strain MF3/22) TaxID=694068 RepID=UPI0004407BD7|nr:uncharacterized protein FOMMEDRAFT_169920 [Fomitiporia mediterranea MF3/22]EJD00483.1 hypothetical protein FOMMEDRAFT_169920 [Fomitiporia mediterranea MF3/22]